uniref:ALA-interacting subunit n=1 Tax=Kalanchoe fedtschenkoi TaxID=63787 RepID=A0A7N0RE09_KALFE
MDGEGESSSSPSLKPESLPMIHSRRCRVINQFTQQNLPACKPILTPAWVIGAFFLICIVFVPVGLISLGASRSVVEIVDRYDIDCIPEAFQRDKVAYIRDTSTLKNCSRFYKVLKTMKAPIYVYYQLDHYYQNHRRYVKSRSDQQLLHGLKYKDISSCKPEESSNGLPVVPCGLIAWSLFNDSYTFIRGSHELTVNKKNISWDSDREHKFGNRVYPFNFQNGSFIGGGNLDQNKPLSEQEDLMVWMRTSALPSFRKLYGKIEEDLNADDVIKVRLVNNYNTYSFGGKKTLVLSTANWLGGRNDFLGLAYISVGFSSMAISLFFTVLHIKYPRPYGDTSCLSWNCIGTST